MKTHLLIVASFLVLTACGESGPVEPPRYQGSDQLMVGVLERLEDSRDLDVIVEIDHSRLGWEAGSTMPPARVVIFSDPEFDAALLQKNPLAGVDLPFRLLAFEETSGGSSALIYNSFDFLSSRYGLPELPGLKSSYEEIMGQVSGDGPLARFKNDEMRPDGIVTLESPFDFERTLEKVQEAIDAQDDTVNFGRVDFKERAHEAGIIINPSTLILFGGPGPGAKAMAKSPTLGLDAFCQKFLVWQDDSGKVFLSFNDLLAVADRQQVHKALPLRVINRRLTSVFSDALEP